MLIGKFEVKAARVTVTAKQVLKLGVLFRSDFTLELGVNE
jgi:hypothetical protein